MLEFLEREFPKEFKKIRFPAHQRIGLKPVSREGTERLVRAALEYALRPEAEERHVRPQGQHHEVHRGRLPELGLRPRRAGVRGPASTPGSSGSGPGPPGARRPPNAEQKAALAAGKLLDQGRHRRHHAAAGPHPPRGVRRHRHAQPERRLPLRRAGGAGGRHRHRAGGQRQLRHRARHLRGDARDRAQVRQSGQGEPRLGRSSRAR